MTHEEKNKLFIENIDFLHYFLHKYYSNYEKEHEDFFSEASASVYEVLDKYSPEEGKLTTFLTPYLKGCISAYIAHDIYHTSIYYYRLMAKIMKSCGSTHTPDSTFSSEEIKEIANNIGLSETTVINTLNHYRAGKYLSNDSIPAFTNKNYNNIDSYLENIELKTDVFNALSHLDYTDQMIIKYTYGLDNEDELNCNEIAKRLSLKVFEVSNRLNTCIELLKENSALKGYV